MRAQFYLIWPPLLTNKSLHTTYNQTLYLKYAPENISIETGLTGLLPRLIIGAQPEFEMAVVIGCQLDLDADWLVAAVAASQHAAPVLPTRLVGSRLEKSKNLQTNTHTHNQEKKIRELL
jgi:hypothetical protein